MNKEIKKDIKIDLEIPFTSLEYNVVKDENNEGKVKLEFTYNSDSGEIPSKWVVGKFTIANAITEYWETIRQDIFQISSHEFQLGDPSPNNTGDRFLSGKFTFNDYYPHFISQDGVQQERLYGNEPGVQDHICNIYVEIIGLVDTETDTKINIRIYWQAEAGKPPTFFNEGDHHKIV